MQVHYALQEFGLREKEAKVYTALLPLGSIKLQELQRRLDYPRTTIYNTLNYLTHKGLVSKIKRKNTTYFEATNPNRLVDSLQQRKEIIESVLPQLEGLKRLVKESSSAEIYEGTKGLSTILLHMLKGRAAVYAFGSKAMLDNALEYVPHLKSRKVSFAQKKSYPCAILIEGDKTAMVGEETGWIIKNKETAKAMKMAYDAL